MPEYRAIDNNRHLPLPARLPSESSAPAMCITNPTQKASAELQSAFNTYNLNLFGSALPACLITLRANKRSYGYFAPDRYIAGNSERCHNRAQIAHRLGMARSSLYRILETAS